MKFNQVDLLHTDQKIYSNYYKRSQSWGIIHSKCNLKCFTLKHEVEPIRN